MEEKQKKINQKILRKKNKTKEKEKLIDGLVFFSRGRLRTYSKSSRKRYEIFFKCNFEKMPRSQGALL